MNRTAESGWAWDAFHVSLLKERRTPRGKAKIGTYAAIVTGAVLLVMAYAGVTFGLGTNDKPAVINTVLTLDAVMFGAVAAVVALAAYWEASGKPSLYVDLLMKYCEDNKPVLRVKPRDGLRWDYIDEKLEPNAELVVHNTAEYAARNPSVVVKLRGISLLVASPGWEVVKNANAAGATELLWDGGADHVIHGQGLRKLPPLPFHEALLLPGAPGVGLDVTLFADGIKPVSVSITLRLVDREGWTQFMEEQKQRRGGAIPDWADASH